MYSYEELQSGDPLFFSGVGHLKPIYLRDIKPSGTGVPVYNYYLQLLKADPPTIVKMINGEGAKITDDANSYSLITSNAQLRNTYRAVLDFFMCELVLYNQRDGYFAVIIKPTQEELENPEFQPNEVGRITQENFDKVRIAMLEMNYVPSENTDIDIKFSSPEAEINYWRVKEWEEKLEPISKKQESYLTMGNMISKICALHPSYNYLNIYDLTVYQFYDTFYQLAYMRGRQFAENVVSHLGGENFDYNEWLKPAKI